jgi:TolA-binding protein
MDNKQLIHIACEGIVIGSVSLYFAKQLKKANKDIEELKEIISKNQAANEKRFEVLFNILDSLNSPQQPQRKIVPQQKKVTIVAPKKKPALAQIKKKVTPIEEEVIEEPIEEEPVEEDEVIDLEEETRTLLEEDVEEDIEA